MGGLVSSIFGSSPSVTSYMPSLESGLNASQTTAEQELMAALQGSNGTAQSALQANTAQTSAPLNSAQTASLAGLENFASGNNSSSAGQQNAISTLNGVMNSTPQDLTGYYNTNVLNPLKQTFNQTTMPSIVSALGGSAGGAQSTAAQNSVAQAANNFSNTLAQTQGTLAYDTGQANITNKLAAANNMPTVSQSPIQSLLSTLQGGTNAQTAQQSADNATAAGVNQTNNNTQTMLADILNLLGQNQQIQSQPVVLGGQNGLLSSLLGSAGTGSSLINMLPSSSSVYNALSSLGG